MGGLQQAPVVFGPAEIFFFLLANAIIIAIVGPKLIKEIKAGVFKW